MLFANFTNWKKNRKIGADVCFGATFLIDVHPSSFINFIKTILCDKIESYYVQVDEETTLPLLDFDDRNSINIRIHSTQELPIENIFIRIDDLKSIKHTMLSVGLPKQSTKVGYHTLAKLLLNEKLFFGAFEEIDYLFWQNCTGLSAYKYRGDLKYAKNSLGEKIVDVSDRPGRYVFTKYFRYAGSSKMWFGPQIYQYIPQEKILSFEGAVEIKVLEHNITFVNLYETVYDGDEPHNQDVQRRFREHIGIDTLKVE